MWDMIRKDRKPYVPESADLHGPAVDALKSAAAEHISSPIEQQVTGRSNGVFDNVGERELRQRVREYIKSRLPHPT